MLKELYIRSGDRFPVLETRLRGEHTGNDIDVPDGSEIILYVAHRSGKFYRSIHGEYIPDKKVVRVNFPHDFFPMPGGRFRGYFRIEAEDRSVPNNETISFIVSPDWRAVYELQNE